MGIEAGGDDYYARAKRAQPRQDRALERLAKLRPAVAGAQRRIDDIVVFTPLGGRSCPGIERRLMRRAIHHGSIGPENLLRAVAMMHIEIHQSRALEPMV